MQREHVSELEVGDYIQLPAAEWHKNPEGKALFAEALELARLHRGEGASPQFQVENESGAGFKAKLVRIR